MKSTDNSAIASSGRRGCDICRSTGRRLLFEQHFVTFDEEAGLLAGYDVVTCAECGFVYADALPDSAVFDRYYREMSKHEPDLDEKRPMPSYQKHNISLITSYVAMYLPDRSARILDVGVGNGEILLALRDLGYEHLAGLDPSPQTAEILRRRHGLRVINTPVSQLKFCAERFDVILLSGVLEHLRDLRATLSTLRALLDGNGKMCIAVPDAVRFVECAKPPYQYFSVEHINFFTLQSLKSLMGSVGMDLQGGCRESTALLGVFEEPIIHCVFKMASVASTVPQDREGADQVSRYVEYSRRQQDVVVLGVQRFVDSGERIIIWGAGSLTMHLLTDRRFSLLKVVAFVDANSNYWDKTILGIPVISPVSVNAYDEMILIASYSYEDEIHEQIRARYRLKNTIVRLFALD